MSGHFKIVPLVLAVNLAAGGIYALATQHTVVDSTPSYQTGMVLGYNVTGITFDLNDTDPTLVDAITFQVAPGSGWGAAKQVEIQTKAEGPWTECSLADDVLPRRVAACTFESLTAEDVTALTIVAK